MNKLKKLCCALLAVLMILPALVACDDKNKNSGLAVTTTTATATTTTSSGGAGLPPIVSNLGIIPEAVDYNGDTYKLLLWSNSKVRLWPEAMVEGESYQNDLYLRNRMVADELGVVFDVTYKDSSSSHDELYNEALEGKTIYEAICTYSLDAPKLALEGVLTDLYSLEYPEIRMPWYPADAYNWEVRNHLFFVADNSAVQNILANWVVYANRTMIENKGLESIEQLVVDGGWTLDVLKTYSRNWAVEAEANNTKVEADRVYGFTLGHRTAMEAFYHGSGFTVYTQDENGDPVNNYFSKTAIEQTSAMVDKLMDLMNSPEFGAGPGNGMTNYNAPLTLRNSAFHLSCLDQYYLMDEDGTFVVIPIPKLDAEQDRYYATTNSCLDTWCVPASASEPELGGMIIEGCAYNDYQEIAPKFWDMDFKYRYSTSQNGVIIFDLIRSSFVVDFGRIWLQLGSPYEQLNRCVCTNTERLILENTYANTILGTKATAMANLKNLKKLMDKMYPLET